MVLFCGVMLKSFFLWVGGQGDPNRDPKLPDILGRCYYRGHYMRHNSEMRFKLMLRIMLMLK